MAAAHSAVERTGNRERRQAPSRPPPSQLVTVAQQRFVAARGRRAWQLPARHQMDCEGLSKQLPLDGAVESQVFSDIHWALIVLLDWPKWSEFQMVLQAPLLRTKLHRPPVTTDLVHRERLHQRLNQGLELPLTLVSAPAGYGKSMLVSHWTQSLDHPCAWLSLDETDRDLTEFLIYMVAAVRTAVPGACPATEELLTAAMLPPVHVLAHRLANGS